MRAKFVYESLIEEKKEKPKLTDKDHKVLNMLLGESLNEAKIEWKKFFPKFKKAAGKGLISAALLLTLMSSNAFGQDQKEVMQNTMNQIEMSDTSGDETEGGGDDDDTEGGDDSWIDDELRSASEDIIKYANNRDAANFLDHLSLATRTHGVEINVSNVNQSGGGDSMAVGIDFDGPGADKETAGLERWISQYEGLESTEDGKFKASGDYGNYSVEVGEKDGHARVIIRAAYNK